MATETDRKVIEAQNADLLRKMEGFMLGAHTLYDIAKAIPHPYNALGDYANNFLHDFRGFAFQLQKHMEHVESALTTEENKK